MRSQNRSPKSILRFHNVSYIHAFRLIQIFGKNPTLEKLYGEYYHSIIQHMPDYSRIIAPSSLHTETEEQIFGAMRGIGLAASQRGAASVRDVGIIRFVFV